MHAGTKPMIRYVDVSQMSAKANGILNIIPISERSELSVIQGVSYSGNVGKCRVIVKDSP